MDAAQMIRCAHTIVFARDNGWLLDQINDNVDFGLDEAYCVQRMMLRTWEDRGERRIGWKLGFTSAAMREQMGIHLPNFGPLTDRMVTTSGSAVGGQLVQPRVEPEIAVRLGRPIAPSADREAVLNSIAETYAALEVVDSVWRNYRFCLEENTADCSSAAQVVLGPALDLREDLDCLPVAMRHNENLARRATGAAAMGHPLDAVAWLASELGRYGFALAANDLVMTGGLTSAVPIGRGERIQAVFGEHTRVDTYRL